MNVRKRVPAAGWAVCRGLCSLESRTVRKWALAALMALAVLATGGRSAKALRILQEAGFRKLSNLQGGITAWSDEVDPTTPKY